MALFCAAAVEGVRQQDLEFIDIASDHVGQHR
jgi:hypothetical protein